MLDKIYIINLDKRPDRWEHVEKKVIPLIPKKHVDKVVRISAVDHTHYPMREQRAAGCSYSHVGIWKHAIENNYSNILIIEDDLKWWVDTHTLEEYFDFFETIDYNVIQIAYRNESELLKSKYEKLVHCDSFITTTSYFANVNFLKTMLPEIEFAASQLLLGKPTRTYAIDIFWRKWQADEKWFGTSQKLGWQIDGISSIENRNEKYKENVNV